jgi:hypothetical protein
MSRAPTKSALLFNGLWLPAMSLIERVGGECSMARIGSSSQSPAPLSHQGRQLDLGYRWARREGGKSINMEDLA